MILGLMVCFAAVASVQAAASPYDGEFVDNKFLRGEGVFQLSVHQNGKAITVAFDAAYKDAHGATPEGTGDGTVSGSAAKFTWKDSHGNLGTGTMNLSGADAMTVSLQVTKMADASCAVFYHDPIQVKRIGKK